MLIETVLAPPEIDLLPEAELSDAVCVVFDVLRATTSMITGLAHGVTGIYPVATIEEAEGLRAALPEAVLGGERHGDRIEGFDIGNSPLEYRDLSGRQVITTTTNGTVALRACARARQTFAAALLNLEATARHIARLKPERMVLVCAGTFREAAFEDIVAAGALIEAFPEAELADASLVARLAFRAHRSDLRAALEAAKNGRVLIQKGRGEDVDWAAQLSVFDVVGEMREGMLSRAE